MGFTKCKRGGVLGNKGFAVSGILYPILILTLFLIVQILTMMASRKIVLDKNKKELLDSVNASNKIYTNEELSILLAEQNSLIESLQKQLDTYQSMNDLKMDSLLKDKKVFHLTKNATKENAGATKLILHNIYDRAFIEVKIFGGYSYINYGGFVSYQLGGFFTSSTIYGKGEYLIKQGEIGNSIGTISANYTSGAVNNRTLTISIPFTKVATVNEKGSMITVEVIVHGPSIENVTAVLE